MLFFLLTMYFKLFIFLASPRLCKITACRHIMGEIVDLQTACEAEKAQPSTGTVEYRSVNLERLGTACCFIT